MKFYSYDYLVSKVAVTDYVQIAVGVVIVLVLAFAGFSYFKNRQDTKYRELALIALIAGLIMIGTKVNEFQVTQLTATQYTGALHFVDVIAEKLKVDKKEIYINTEAAHDGAIVKVRDQFYRVIVTDEVDRYLFEKMSVYEPTIELVEVE